METYFWDGEVSKRVFSTISEQELNQNVGEVTYILTYSSKRRAWLGNKDKIYIYLHFVMSRQWWPPKDIFFRDSYTLCLFWMHWFLSHLIYLRLTKPTMQQCFHPSAKHLLYRYYITLNFLGHSFRVEGGTWYVFANSQLCTLI